jgi:hypothetical protein
LELLFCPEDEDSTLARSVTMMYLDTRRHIAEGIFIVIVKKIVCFLNESTLPSNGISPVA